MKHNENGVTNIIKTLQISFIEHRFFDQKCNAFFQCSSADYTILFCIFCHFNIQLSRKNWQFIGNNGDDVFARKCMTALGQHFMLSAIKCEVNVYHISTTIHFY